MNNCIANFTHNSTLKSNKLSRSKSTIKIYNNTELGMKRKKNECMSHRLNDLARPNVRRIKSIFEKQKKKSKFDMIKAEKLLKLMNEPLKKPLDVKRCIKEMKTYNKSKQERVTYSTDKEYEKCRQYRDFQCLINKKVLLENRQKDPYNSSFKPQKKLIIDNNKKSRTNYNVTNFKVSTEKYITTEEFERRCRNDNLKPSIFTNFNKTNENFVLKKLTIVDDKKACQNSEDLRNVPRSLFISRDNNDNKRTTYHVEKTTLKTTRVPRITTTSTENKAVTNTKMTLKQTIIVDQEMSSNEMRQNEASLALRQYTFDSGFIDRLDEQNMTSYVSNPKKSTEVTSPKDINEDTNHSDIKDLFLGQVLEIPGFSIVDSSVDHEDKQSIELNSNLNFPNSTSTSNDVSNVVGMSTKSQESSTMNSQLQEQFQVQNYSYPDIYENCSISLLSENDSSILKLSMNSSVLEGPQNFIAKQSSFNNSANISDFGTFVAKQEENSSRNFSQLPVIALRDFSGYHDVDIDKDNEILIRVTSANFDKIYVITKISDKMNLNEFCKSPVSSKSKLFLLNGSKEKKEIEIKRLGTNSLKQYCGKGNQGRVEDYSQNSLLSSVNQEKFSVQKIDKISNSLESKGIDIHVTENSDKNSNFTVIKEQVHFTHTKRKSQN